jgi:hypothetical protein
MHVASCNAFLRVLHIYLKELWRVRKKNLQTFSLLASSCLSALLTTSGTVEINFIKILCFGFSKICRHFEISVKVE